MAETRERKSGCLSRRRRDDEGQESLGSTGEDSTSSLNTALGGEAVEKDEVGGPGGAELGAGGEGGSPREGGREESLGRRLEIRDVVERDPAEEGIEEGESGAVVEEGEEGGAGLEARGERGALQGLVVSLRAMTASRLSKLTLDDFFDLALTAARSATTIAQKGWARTASNLLDGDRMEPRRVAMPIG